MGETSLRALSFFTGEIIKHRDGSGEDFLLSLLEDLVLPPVGDAESSDSIV